MRLLAILTFHPLWALNAISATATNVHSQIIVPLSLAAIVPAKNADEVTTFTGEPTSAEAGTPALPRLTVKILLPPDSNLSTVKAAIRGMKTEALAGKWNVSPAPPVSILGSGAVWPNGVQIREGRAVDIYETDAFYPSSHIGTVTTGQLREWKLAEVQVFPYRYNPVTQNLIRLTDGDLLVSFERMPGTKSIRSNPSPLSLRTRDTVKNMVSNFEQAVHAYAQQRP